MKEVGSPQGGCKLENRGGSTRDRSSQMVEQSRVQESVL